MKSALAQSVFDPSVDRGICFGLRHSRRRTTPFATDVTLRSLQDIERLPPETAQHLSTVLRFLLCGEESATHTFSDVLMRDLSFKERATLQQIAREEAGHAALIAQWTHRLPPPLAVFDATAARRFFRHLLTSDRALHFARVSALDAIVCRLISRLLRGSALKPFPGLRESLSAIRAEEINHVRVTQFHAQRLGLPHAMARRTAIDVRQRLTTSMAPAHSALQFLTARSDAVAEHRRLGA